jgi:hypothetical protein
MSALLVEILNYEDSYDEDHSAVTHYIIKVTNTKTKHSYELRKRYSEFAKLYTELRDNYEVIENFRFPKKSVFNTQATFTKERRREGFDQFLKLLVPLMPIPEVSEFLELEKNFFMGSPKKSAQVDEKGGTNVINDNHKSTSQEKLKSKVSEREGQSQTSTSKKDSTKFSHFFFYILPSSSTIVILLYSFLFSMKLIDVTGTTNGKLTLIILFEIIFYNFYYLFLLLFFFF